MSTCLLSFSGGLDSLAAAITLREAEYDVSLGHIEWTIEGTAFGQDQTVAARRLAKELKMPLEVLARMWFPESSYAKYSWVPVCISTIMHHAGDGCVYPGPMQRRYDAVAFGFDGVDYAGNLESVSNKQHWMQGMLDYAYNGTILFPNNGKSRWAGDYSMVPERLWGMAVSCYQGVVGGGACPGCPKCRP